MVNHPDAILALTMVPPGQRVRVVDIMAGQQVNHRLAELGVIRGVELNILHDHNGPLILSVRDTRVVLERGVAHKIRVQPV